MSLSPAATRLEKAALDNGFDQELPCDGPWLAFASTHAPLKVWLATREDGSVAAALSREDVAQEAALGERSLDAELPAGAAAAHVVPDIPTLHHFLRRAWQLSKTLPQALFHEFELTTRVLPRATEAERLVVQRVGQDLFRRGLLDYWQGRCAVTDLAVPELLRASHIKPWAKCDSDAERLDVYNGLLLAPHLDALFDAGLVTFEDDGTMRCSGALEPAARAILRVDENARIARLHASHRAYLQWHRSREFVRR